MMKLDLYESRLFGRICCGFGRDEKGYVYIKEDEAASYDAAYTDSKVMVDGKQVQFEAYNIADNNYFKLRDLGKLFDFDVSWDGANNCVLIDSANSYTQD